MKKKIDTETDRPAVRQLIAAVEKTFAAQDARLGNTNGEPTAVVNSNLRWCYAPQREGIEG